MLNFALICEGITDQVAIDLILHYHYGEHDIYVNPLQPLRDATDQSRQANYGGWEAVLEYCSVAEFEQLLQYNDYIIIQIDTDQADHANFGVGLTDKGQLKTTPKLVDEVIGFIKSKIDSNIIKEYADRFLFAICVNSLECWIVPIFKNFAKEKTHNCGGVLERELNKASKPFKKDYDGYELLFDHALSSSGLSFLASKSTSLQIFIGSLPTNLNP